MNRTPWRPRPKPAPALPIFVGALFLAGIGLCAFAVFLAFAAERERREFDGILASYDQTRVTEAEINAAVGRPGEEIAMQSRRPAPAGVVVKVTFYDEEYRGKPMAITGEPFDPDAFTCAHRELGAPGKPLVYVRFTAESGRQIDLPVTDRGPYDRFPAGHPKAGQYRKEFDLSAAAFRFLSPDMTGGEGLPVCARVLGE